jgi:hypothetical protein
VASESQSWDGHDVGLLIPYVARNAHGSQDTAPLQTILLNGEYRHAEIVAWTIPDADLEVSNSVTLIKAAVSARLVLTVTTDSGWRDGMKTAIFDAMLSDLPLNAISTLVAQNRTRLTKEVWLSHAPRLTKLNRVFLVDTAVRAFREMLEEDASPNGLPRLGALLETLNLRLCIGCERAVEVLSETVGNMEGPPSNNLVRYPITFNWEGGGVIPFDDEEREITRLYKYNEPPWHGSTDEGDEDEDDEFDDSDEGEGEGEGEGEENGDGNEDED